MPNDDPPGGSDEPSEDRGTALWIWLDEDGLAWFERPILAVERIEMSMPIGWGLRTNVAVGVVLANVLGKTMSADVVLLAARARECGFRIRGRENQVRLDRESQQA